MNLVYWIGPAGVQLLLVAVIALIGYLVAPVPGRGYTMVGQVLVRRVVAWWRSRHRTGGIIPTDLPPAHYNCRRTLPPGFHVEPGEPFPPLPDYMLTWPGKAEGRPRPPILWLKYEPWPTCPTCGAWLVAGTAATKTCPACPLESSNNPTTDGGTAP